MITKGEIAEILSELAERRGLQLYDMDLPRGRRGVLRLFVCKGHPRLSQITLDDCALLSGDILALEEVERLLPGEVRLEVSSPGINRKLSTEQHFCDARGERVRIKLRQGAESQESTSGAASLLGTLEECSSGELVVRCESSGELRRVSLASISSAHVEYPF